MEGVHAANEPPHNAIPGRFPPVTQEARNKWVRNKFPIPKTMQGVI